MKATSIVILFLTYALSCNAQDDLKVIQSIKKVIEFDTQLTKSEKEIFLKCQKWKLDKEDIYLIFSKSESETPENIQSTYYYLPCYYFSKVKFKGNLYKLKVNAASFIVLYNQKETLYFGCKDAELEKYFVLKPSCCDE